MTTNNSEILVNCQKIDNGFIGQCAENPQFLVQTKTKNQIKTEIKEMIEDYVKIFPKEKLTVMPDGNDFKIVLKNK